MYNMKVTGMSDFYNENKEVDKYCWFLEYKADPKYLASCISLYEASYNDIKNKVKDIEKKL